MRWNFEIKTFWTLQLKFQNNHTTLYVSKKGCVFKWIWETIEHYAYTQVKVKEQRLYCCSTLCNHNFAVQCDKWITMYQWIQLYAFAKFVANANAHILCISESSMLVTYYMISLVKWYWTYVAIKYGTTANQENKSLWM